MASGNDIDLALKRILDGATADEVEGPTLDFKEDRATPGDVERLLAEAAICFANAAGGTVVLGVSDKLRGPAAMIGTTLDAERVRQRIFELSRPHLLVDVRRPREHPKLLVISVPQSPEIHSDTQGRAYRRINKSCLPMTPDQQARLREEKQGFDWSAQDSGTASAEAAPEAMSAARALVGQFTDERRRLAGLGDADLLGALGALADRKSLNRAGALLFCRKGLEHHEIIYQYRPTPGGEPQVAARVAPPFVLGFARIMELVAARRTLTPITLPSGQQFTIEDFPELAVREALSNAMCHRDYTVGRAVAVEHSPQVLAVDSPGPLVSSVTLDNILTTPPKPRNPALARAARTLGLAEEFGRGIDRIFREMIRAGRAVPRIEADFDRVRVTMVGGAPNTQIARFVATLPEHEREDTDTMLVILHMCSHKTVTAEAITTLIQKSPEEAAAILARLATPDLGLLERNRASATRRQAVYRLSGEGLRGLGSAVSYHRRTTDEIDKKVIAHVREYGRITNRTLQNFLDVHVFKARDIISDLAHRGILDRVSAQSRGTKVEWGPGPKFPATRARRTPGTES